MSIKLNFKPRLKGEFKFIFMLLNYCWIVYYHFATRHDQISFFYRYGYKLNENSLFGLAWISWGIGALIFLKISYSIIFFDKNIIKNTFIIVLFLPCFILSFFFFSGLFLGHSKPIYFINFNYLFDDVIFLFVCSILYFLYYYKNTFIAQ